MFTFIAPVLDFDNSGFGSATAPATCHGGFTGYACEGDFTFCLGPPFPVWQIVVQGEGSVTLSAGQDSFPIIGYGSMGFHHAGTATPIPEPSSFAMVGSGILGIVGLLRHKLLR